PQDLSFRQLRRKRRIGLLGPQKDVAAGEAQMRIAHQRARQEAHFGEHLKAVADAEHQATRRGVTPDRLHDRSELRQRAGAQIIAVREAAGDDYAVNAFEIRLLVPKHFRLGAEEIARDVQRVVIAIGTGEDDDAEFHNGYRLPVASYLTGNWQLATGNSVRDRGSGHTVNCKVSRAFGRVEKIRLPIVRDRVGIDAIQR